MALRTGLGPRASGLGRRIAPYLPAAIVVALAALIVWGFAATVLAHTRPMGLPLDDSYIYLTYAKQFGRAQPFTYFPGGGYSAGSTSVLWPMLLAPFWTLGARGHALVWVSFGLCGALYAAVGIGLYHRVRAIAGRVAGGAAATMALVIAPFAWCSLSGMEVAFASALLVASLLLLARLPVGATPTRLLGVCLAATSLSRPEAMLVVFAICAVRAVARARARELGAAAWWLAPLVAPVGWLLANRMLAGHWLPNTGVAKSHFYLPGFDWTYWRDTVRIVSGKMLRGLFWDKTSPLVWPRLVAALFLVGTVRLVVRTRTDRRWLDAALAIAAPVALMFAVVAASGLWSFQNYRYIAPAFPLLFVPVGVALGCPFSHVWVRRGWHAAVVALVAVYANAARPALVADMKLYAQGAMDTNTQVTAIGEYLHAKLPDASVMFHDAGAIAYYGDTRVYDMLGLVTNGQAEVASNGPGARFEFLESLPVERRPTHFAYYPGWMGTPEFFGEAVMHTALRPGFEPRRLVGEADMQILTASWDHVGTGERPLNDHAGWTVVDRVDVADVASERAHHWVGRMGRRVFGDPTARWSLTETETVAGLVIDGGRTIRGGPEAGTGETFTIRLDPTRPSSIVIRTGGKPSYPWHDAITKPVTLALWSHDKELAHLVIAPPASVFSELTFNLPPFVFKTREVEVHTEATGVYRVFHWFVLQPQ